MRPGAPNPGLEATADSPLWERVRRPRFLSRTPRAVLVTSGYFLEREIVGAFSRLGWALACLPVPPGGRGSTEFVAGLLGAAAAFRPDFLLTVNHLGLDRQGVLLDLAGRMALPVASWFVDSPRLILHDYPGQASPWLALFTWDRDTLAPLADQGFGEAVWLPLATDTTLFRPGAGQAPPRWRAGVSFVGDSMQAASARLAGRLKGFPRVLDLARRAAPGFAQSPERLARDYLERDHPELSRLTEELPTAEARLDVEQFVTWEATRVTRQALVRGLLPLGLLVAGDAHWKSVLGPAYGRVLGGLDYYRDLPRFYPASAVSFNCTSLQMKGAVNQRVFDVPACGGFVLTDFREQLGELFEPGREVVCYRDADESLELARHYLAHPVERQAVSRAARERILARHDYTHRLRAMVGHLKRRFA